MRLNIYPAAFLLLIGVCFSGCFLKEKNENVRPELKTMFSHIDSARANRVFSEYDRIRLDSVLAAHEPLNTAEKLWKYGFYQWYYAEYQYNQYNNANKVIDSALALLNTNETQEDNPEVYRTWLLFKGDALVQLKQLSEAFYYYYEVKRSADVQSDDCLKYRLSTRLGNIRYMQSDFKDAIHYFKQAQNEHKGCMLSGKLTDYYQRVTEPQGLLNGLGMFFEMAGQQDSSRYYYQQALRFLDDHAEGSSTHVLEEETARGVVFGNLGGLLSKIGDYEAAENYLLKSLAINEQADHDVRDAITAKLKLADLYTKMDKPENARQLLRECTKELDSLPNDGILEELKYANWHLAERTGNTGQMYATLKDYHNFKDSLASVYNKRMSVDFASAFEQMDQMNNFKTLTSKNKKNFTSLLVTIIILLLMIAVAFLIFRNWKRSQGLVLKLKKLNDHIGEKNKKLTQALSALEESQQDNTRILAMVAHDLRGPIGNVKIAVEFLMRKQLEIGPENARMLEMVHKAAQRALELIRELTEVYRDGHAYNKEMINLEAMIMDCVSLMKIRADEKEQVVNVSTEQIHFEGSGEKLWRIMSNLIINAIKFTPRKGSISIALKRTSKELCIEVSDNGIGIPRDMLEQIFEFEKRKGRPGTEGEPSTGLGLAIVKQLVTYYQGRIEISSREGKGTTFSVLLPLAG